MTTAGKKLKKLINTAVSQKTSVNWEEVLVEWKTYVSKLYDQVEHWIKKSGVSQKVQIERELISISENYIGSYKIDQLLLKVGDNIIRFIPQGRLIIGSRGRVDIVCGSKKVLLLLLGKNAKPSITVQEFHSKSEYEKHQKTESKKVKKNPSQDLVWKISSQIPTIEVKLFTENEFAEVFEQLIS